MLLLFLLDVDLAPRRRPNVSAAPAVVKVRERC